VLELELVKPTPRSYVPKTNLMLRHKTRPKFNNIGRKTLIIIHYNMDQSDKGSSLAATLDPLWQQKVLQQRRQEKQP
jgi:hypothetical protein